MKRILSTLALLFAFGANAQTEIQDLTPLAAAPASNDLILMVDVSDTTDSADGTAKIITPANLFLFAFSNANTFTAAQTAQITDAGTNTVVYPLIVDHQSSGTPANGQGVGLAFDVETTAANTERGATIEAVITDVTAASEDVDVVVKTMVAGAAASERIRVAATNAAANPLLTIFGETTTGFYRQQANGWAWAKSGTAGIGFGLGSNTLSIGSGWQLGWAATASPGGAQDTGLARNAAGVIRASDGSTAIRGFLGGGSAVASAAALPVPTGRVFHVTGTTGITSITSTNFGSGACVTMIFDDALTVTDGSNLKLAGDFTTTADDTLSVCYDGTSWFETGRSVN